jgi:hypothetical protein
MQQGRVQLDADWNEQAAILLHYLQTLAADLIGPAGGPQEHLGFGLVDPGALSADEQARLKGLGILPLAAGDFLIGGGRYYVDGILCENENNVSYLHQPDAPGWSALNNGNSYLVYLDVWERYISSTEDGDIREVALGGPDTAGRARVVWQVRTLLPSVETARLRAELDALQHKLEEAKAAKANDQIEIITRKIEALQKRLDSFPPALDCNSASNLLGSQAALSDARLRARAKQDQPPTDACIILPEARYRGPENQLYRVEIHTGSLDGDGNPAQPTFKWSRENGSVVFPVLDVASDAASNSTRVTLAHLGRDQKLSVAIGDWVELVDDDYALQNRADRLLRVKDVDRVDMAVTLDGMPAAPISADPAKHPLMRRWDQKQGDPKQGGLELGSDNAALIVEGTGEDDSDWLALEDGVRIQFQPGGTYRTGDYWLVPARTATGDVEWPQVLDSSGKNMVAAALPSRGVLHHYAPLMVISVDGGNVKLQSNCRCTINPLVRCFDQA